MSMPNPINFFFCDNPGIRYYMGGSEKYIVTDIRLKLQATTTVPEKNLEKIMEDQIGPINFYTLSNYHGKHCSEE